MWALIVLGLAADPVVIQSFKSEDECRERLVQVREDLAHLRNRPSLRCWIRA
jgi:hypothetical protein